MARKFGNAIDLSQFEIRNAVVQNLAAAPGSPKPGQLYYDTTSNTLYWWNNTAWTQATGSTSSFGVPGNSAPGDAAAQGVATTISRSDHAHGREAFGTTISALTPGGASSGGAATTTTRSDHTHGLPAFAAPTTETTFGTSSSAGAAATFVRSDHTHGNPTHDNAAHAAINLSALTAPTVDVSWGSHKITSLLDPTNPQDAATKNYVDITAQGLDFKPSVLVATTANITLTGEQTIDGVTTSASRVLVKNQTTANQNGIYVSAAGAWTRAADMNSTANTTTGALTFVEQGTANGGQQWILTTTGAITVGTTSLTFTQFSGASALTAGGGLTATGNVFAVGAGNGITVNADSIQVDTAVVTRKFAQAIGDGTTTSYVVTHNLGTTDVQVTVYVNSGTFDEIITDVQHTSTNTVTVIFGTAPAANAYRVVVQG